MAYEFNGYGNVKVVGWSAWALRPASEHSRSYITGGSADRPNGRMAATGCQNSHNLLIRDFHSTGEVRRCIAIKIKNNKSWTSPGLPDMFKRRLLVKNITFRV